MSRTADCYDNAAMESFFHRFKGECIDVLTPLFGVSINSGEDQ